MTTYKVNWIDLAVLFFVGMLWGLQLFPLVYMLVTGDFPGSRIFYGIQEDDVIVDFLLKLHGL